jgi:hypothetical protein
MKTSKTWVEVASHPVFHQGANEFLVNTRLILQLITAIIFSIGGVFNDGREDQEMSQSVLMNSGNKAENYVLVLIFGYYQCTSMALDS